MSVTHPDGVIVPTRGTWRQKIHAITELPEQVKTVSVIAGIGICVAIIALAVAVAAYAHTHNAKVHVNAS